MTRKCPVCGGSGYTEKNDMAMDIALFGAPMNISKRREICNRCGGDGEIISFEKHENIESTEQINKRINTRAKFLRRMNTRYTKNRKEKS